MRTVFVSINASPFPLPHLTSLQVNDPFQYCMHMYTNAILAGYAPLLGKYVHTNKILLF